MPRSLVSLAVAVVIATGSVPAVHAAEPSATAGDPLGSAVPAAVRTSGRAGDPAVPADASGSDSLAPIATETPAATATPNATENPVPDASPTATPAAPYDGTIVVDPTFVSGGEVRTQPAPTAHPGAPGVTPPPTDASSVAAPRTDAPFSLLLLVAAALAGLVIIPASRARPARMEACRSRSDRPA